MLSLDAHAGCLIYVSVCKGEITLEEHIHRFMQKEYICYKDV